ncbi:hypothetical protein PUN28_009578 [Cardiocondyla obscurior]|uniref:Uncharacterized protein n=1 Tax=Cardiocondyla obscurior TaxID=286306 RepID=A0AAW2FUY5_9HYME
MCLQREPANKEKTRINTQVYTLGIPRHRQEPVKFKGHRALFLYKSTGLSGRQTLSSCSIKRAVTAGSLKLPRKHRLTARVESEKRSRAPRDDFITTIYSHCQNSINPTLPRDRTTVFTFLASRVSRI